MGDVTTSSAATKINVHYTKNFVQGAAERTPRFGKLIKTKPSKIKSLSLKF
jgi:hypothetical protein